MSSRNEVIEDLTAYIDGELSELDARRVEEALGADPALAALERRMRAVVGAVAKLEAPAPSPALGRALLARLDTPTLTQRLRAIFSAPRWLPAGALAAAAVAAVVVLRGERPPALDVEQLYVAQNMELAEDLDVLGLESPDDLEVVTQLHTLEQTP